MNFITLRDRTLASRMGHIIEFKKGVPTHVPAESWEEALAIGAAPEDDLPEPEKRASNEPADVAERKEAIFAAFESILNTGGREAFAASGMPSAKAINKALGWNLSSRERGEMWVKYLAEKGLD